MQAQDNYHRLYKFLLLGDSGVGKSCLLLRFVDDVYHEEHPSPLGFKTQDIVLRGKIIKLQIWDTRGPERCRRLPSGYRPDGIIVCFDFTNQQSFLNIKNWLDDIDARGWCGKERIIIVGTKADLVNEKRVDLNEAKEWAALKGCSLIETSSLKAYNVHETFHTLADEISTKKIVQTSAPQAQPEAPVPAQNTDQTEKCFLM